MKNTIKVLEDRVERQIPQQEHRLQRHRSLKMARDRKSRRAAETRTKIQFGGLVIKAGLPHLLGIAPGDDIQRDRRTEAAILLGGLLFLVEFLTGERGAEITHNFKGRGLEAFSEPPGKPKQETP